jgi:hypothetical protein
MDLMLGNRAKAKAKIQMAEIEGRKGPMRIARFYDAVR